MERLIAAFSLGLLLLVGGCVNPEFPAGGYFVCSQWQPDCPDGYTCKGDRCVKEGSTLDSSKDAPADASLDSSKDIKPAADSKPTKDGKPTADIKPVKDIKPGTDLKPVTESKPVKDLKPWPDLKPVKDSKPWPDQKPATDSTPWPDQGTTSPVVTLKTPSDPTTSYYNKVAFTFTVTSSYTITRCELLANKVLRGYVNNPASPYSITWKNIPDGSYTWDVRCKDQFNNWGTSNEGRVFKSLTYGLNACKSSGWLTNYKYKLNSDITKVNMDCFVIDKAGVYFDGNNKSIISTKVKDVLYDRSSDEPFTVLQNNHFGTGKLWAPLWVMPLTGATPIYHPAAGDFDADGDLDLITPSSGDYLRVWKNPGTGKFGSGAAFTTGGKNYNTSRVLDYDLDGKLDFVASNYGASEVFFRGAGSTSGFSAAWGAPMGAYTQNMDVADFNNDAKVDILAGSRNLGSYDDRRHMRLNNLKSSGGGTFTAAWTSSTSNARGSGFAYVADFNGDNDWDMLLPRYNGIADQASILFHNDGKGSFSPGSSYSTTSPAGALDIDRDGDTDLVLYKLDIVTAPYTYKRMALKFYLGNGKGTFTYQSSLYLFLSKQGGFVVLTDVTGDGYPDVVFAPAGETEKLRVFENKIPGSFKNIWTDPAAGAVSSLALRDLDNDGDLDIFAGRSYTKAATTINELAYLENSGKGTFTQKWSKSASGGRSYRVYAMGDLDGSPTTGIQVSASGVTVKNFKAIRGFSVGVEVTQPECRIEDVVVEDPDLFGFRVSYAKNTALYEVAVKRLHQGVGVGVFNSIGVVVTKSIFCDAGYSRNLTPVSAYCFNSSVTGSSNSVKINNGCSSLGWSSCK